MKKTYILFILVTSRFLLCGQDIPNFLKERTEFCNSNFTDEQALQLRNELKELEDYFIQNGLLSDKSGESYWAVFKQIVKEDDFNFKIERNFNLLDTLEFQVYTGCFFKALKTEELVEINPYHLKALERIAEGYEGNVTVGVISRRIIENLTENDFELRYFKFSSLLTFYRIAYR